MRRGLIICLVAAIMLAAGSASAGMYASLRMTGGGNYYLTNPFYYYYGRQYCCTISEDKGLFDNKELAIGFGDKVQGEISFGFNSKTEAWAWESDRENTDDYKFSSWNVGIAGFYPVAEGDMWRVDAGLRFKYMAMKAENEWAYDRDGTDTYTMNGFSVGPVVRHTWFLADGAIGIGPEVGIKYSSFKTENEWDYSRTESEDGPDITGIDFEYSLRLDFFFN
jgi:hypothetical protein